MRWEDNARGRFFYRDRNHQAAQLQAAVTHAGPLEGKTVLDVGCGYGDLLYYLPPCAYVGIDPNRAAIKEARKTWPGWDFRATSRVTPADVVIAVASLQCCKDPRRALHAWMEAARERLVVVTCTWDRLPEDWQDEAHWGGIVREVYPSDDDFVTCVVRPPAVH